MISPEQIKNGANLQDYFCYRVDKLSVKGTLRLTLPPRTNHYEA
jgi:hypothetical protein